jgi:hypothetical protein
MQVGRVKRGLVVESLGVSYVLDKLFLFDYSSQVKSSYYSPIIHFELFKEQQHSQKQDFLVLQYRMSMHLHRRFWFV